MAPKYFTLRIVCPVEGPGVVVQRDAEGWPALLNVRVDRWVRICRAWRARKRRRHYWRVRSLQDAAALLEDGDRRAGGDPLLRLLALGLGELARRVEGL